MLTEKFLEQGSLSCAFEEEEDSCRWGNGVQSTEAGMGSRHMLRKSVSGILVGVKGCQARWDWKKYCLQSFHIRGEGGKGWWEKKKNNL